MEMKRVATENLFDKPETTDELLKLAGYPAKRLDAWAKDNKDTVDPSKEVADVREALSSIFVGAGLDKKDSSVLQRRFELVRQIIRDASVDNQLSAAKLAYGDEIETMDLDESNPEACIYEITSMVKDPYGDTPPYSFETQIAPYVSYEFYHEIESLVRTLMAEGKFDTLSDRGEYEGTFVTLADLASNPSQIIGILESERRANNEYTDHHLQMADSLCY